MSFPAAEPLLYSDDDPLPDSPPTTADLPTLAIRTVPEHPAVAAAASTLLTVLVGLKSPPLPLDARRAPLDLVIVLDVSGSMYGTKLSLVKRAAQFVADNLSPADRLAIVTFADHAQRVTRLRTMAESGRSEVRAAISNLSAGGCTNIVDGLRTGARVLEQRRWVNRISGIIFLSDGNDTVSYPHRRRKHKTEEEEEEEEDAHAYLHLLPASIRPVAGDESRIPVHSFGFGSDHDPIAMHCISEASGGTFSFIESYKMVQDAFAGCIGGLLSVVAQDVRLTVRAASHGVEIKSIPAGRHVAGIFDSGTKGVVEVGDLYADEEKEFLINLFIPEFSSVGEIEIEAKTTVLDVVCIYKDAFSGETIRVEGDLVEIHRPNFISISDMMANLEIDRQRNRILAAEAIAEAQRMAEVGDLDNARTLLARKRDGILQSASGHAGDELCMWLECELREMGEKMENSYVYKQSGRAFALSGMSSHGQQRATTRMKRSGRQSSSSCYATPNMVRMVMQSRQAMEMEMDEEISTKE